MANSNIVLLQFLCVIVIVAVSLYHYERFSSSETSIFTSDAAQALTNINYNKYNSPCSVKTAEGTNFKFAYSVNGNDIPVWYSTDNPDVCGIEISGDDLENDTSKCSPANVLINDTNVVDGVSFDDASKEIKRCEVRIKPNLSENSLRAYFKRQLSYKQKMRQERNPYCAAGAIKRYVPNTVEPTWEFVPSKGRWTYLTQNTSVQYSSIGILSSKNKSITMWINVRDVIHWWRNIFHVTNSGNNCCSPGDRIPAMWIWPGSTRLHICHDTTAKSNENFNPEGLQLGKNTFVALIWSDKKLTVYLNDEPKGTYDYEGELIEAEATAKLFLSSPWYPTSGILVKNIQFWNKTLSYEDLQKIKKATIFEPSWEYGPSKTQWARLSRGHGISYGQLGITTSKAKSFTFWLYISSIESTWRNIFHVSNHKRDWGSMGDRIPSVWVWPGSTNLHICHDTSLVTNENYNPSGVLENKPAFVALVWSGRLLNVYIDSKLVGSYQYWGDLIEGLPNGTFYISDPWYENKGLMIKQFQAWNRSLTSDEVSMLQETS